jgi:hypothetical protein
MRLHRHDELVEAMAMGLEHWFWPRADARAAAATALDALLAAVVEKGVGKEAGGTYGHEDRGGPWVAAEHWAERLGNIDQFPALILKREPTR